MIGEQLVLQVEMNKNKACEMLCSRSDKSKISEKQSKLLIERIKQEYTIHL